MARPLANQKSKPELEKEIQAETFARKIASFYRYQRVENPHQLRDDLYSTWRELNVRGRIYVSYEGINAQFSVPTPFWQKFKESLERFELTRGIWINESTSSNSFAFLKLIIKVREKIVSDGLSNDLFQHYTPSAHLSPSDFHQVLEKEDCQVIDVRNDYECEIGHFENAYLPKGLTFSEILPEISEKFADKKEQKLLLYCTGGIRCEKASAYLRSQGFENVFQLQGGIINYVNEMQAQGLKSKYQGSLFVFDGRMAEPVIGASIGKCYLCEQPQDVHIDCSNVSCNRMILHCPSCREISLGYCSESCKSTALLTQV